MIAETLHSPTAQLGACGLRPGLALVRAGAASRRGSGETSGEFWCVHIRFLQVWCTIQIVFCQLPVQHQKVPEGSGVWYWKKYEKVLIYYEQSRIQHNLSRGNLVFFMGDAAIVPLSLLD